MRRCEKEGKQRGKRKIDCKNHRIFLEEAFISEVRESILGHADMRIYILNVSPDLSPLSHLIFSLK